MICEFIVELRLICLKMLFLLIEKICFKRQRRLWPFRNLLVLTSEMVSLSFHLKSIFLVHNPMLC